MLVDLLQYGKPRVTYLSEGWYACVEMNTPTIGTNFQIASEFKHPSPSSALRECSERVEAAMKVFGK